MSKIIWDKAGEHYYETGVDHGVLYPTNAGAYQNGVPWNGLTSISESPTGAESTAQYADNIKYLNLISAEEFGATVEAFTYPPEFAVCDGSAEPVPGVRIGQQNRRPFGLCYRTLLGNDLQNTDYGYLIHLIYGATAAPSERAYSTVNDSPEAITFSWEITTTPVEVPGYKPTASLIIDSTKVGADAMAKLEEILYGTETTEPRLPMPEEVFALMGSSRSITISVSAPANTATILGSVVTPDLQGALVIDSTNKTISGDVKYYENFTDFSTTAELQAGNFVAIEYNVTTAGANPTVTAELLGGTADSYKVVSGGFGGQDELASEDTVNASTYGIICRVTNKDTQTIKISVTDGKENATVIYTLKGLTMATAASLG